MEESGAELLAATARGDAPLTCTSAPPDLPGPPGPPCFRALPADSVSDMLTGFHHVTLNVTDLGRARAFYEGVLGLRVDQDFPDRKLRLRIGETGRLVLRPLLPGTPPGDRFSERRVGLDHLAIGVSGRAEVERLAEVLRENGVAADLHNDPLGAAIVTFRDPDNFQWEFFEEA
jgi:glyoxylase I family protein